MFLLCKDKDRVGVRTLTHPDRMPQSVRFIKINYEIEPEEVNTYNTLDELKEYVKQKNIDPMKIYGANTIKERISGHLSEKRKLNRRAEYRHNKESYKIRNREAYKRRITVKLDTDSEDEQ